MYPAHKSSPIAVGLFLLLTGLTAALADGPTTQPAATASPPSQPSDASQIGVVRAALTQLYVIPRGPAPMPGSARLAQKPSTQPASAGPPAITIDRNPAARKPSAAAQTNAPAASGKAPPAGNLDAAAASEGSDVQQVATLIESTPWTHTGSPLSERDRDWANYRYYGGRPSAYGVGQYSPYASRSYGDEEDVYRFGFMEGSDYGRFANEADARVEALMSHASVQIDRGVQYFHKGQYQQAADTFQLAAETDQGDSISRIYAGHSLFALGRYRDAVRYIRRAFELQPRVAYLTYDIRGDYENPALFEQQMRDLGKALDLSPRDSDRLFLLGYMNYYTGQRMPAYRYFMRAVEVDRKDTISDRLMRNAQPPDVEVDTYLRHESQQK